MKIQQILHKNYCFCRFLAWMFALAALCVACTEDLPIIKPVPGGQIAPDALAVTPMLFSLDDNQTIRTRALGDDVPVEDYYNEDFIRSIDVFFLDGDNVLRHFTQTKDDAAGFPDRQPVTLADNWKAEDLVAGKTYDVYVLVNNLNMQDGVEPQTRQELLELTTVDPQIHKRYKAGADSKSEIFTPEKTFMMDGFINDWTPDATSPSQNIQVELKRAAVKVMATFELSTDMEAVDAEGDPIYVKTGTPENEYNNPANWIYSNTTHTGVYYYADKKKTQAVTAEQVEGAADAKVRARMSFEDYLESLGHRLGEGSPMWKYVNFSHCTRDIDGAPMPDDYKLDVSDGVMGLEDGTTWKITTYTYEQDWNDVSKAEQYAPFLLVSIPIIMKDDENVTYHYYRLPIVDESKYTATERNNIYYSHTKIESMGSTSLDSLTNPVNLRFEVLPWEIGESEVTNVMSEHLYFLLVQPTQAELRGTNPNTVKLNFYAPSTNRLLIDASSLNISFLNSSKERQYLVENGRLKGTQSATYTDGQSVNVGYRGNSGGTNVTNNTQISIENGTITVTSDVLYNQAIKTISFRVYLEGLEETLYQDITIQHYPVDNIQSFEGWWSSKYSSYTRGKKTVREYTYSLAEAQSWGIETDTQFETEETTTPISGVEPLSTEVTDREVVKKDEAWTSRDYERDLNINNLREIRDDNSYWQDVDSEDDSKPNSNNNSDGWYYWGEGGPDEVNWRESYDYRTGSGSNRKYWKYESYHRVQYIKETTTYTYKKWYRDVEIDGLIINSTWAFLNEYTGGSTVSGGGFTSRVYDKDDVKGTGNKFYNMSYNTSKRMGQMSNTTSSSNLTNNNMYVIQITSASNQYVLGSPTLDNNKQSKDMVVYPALMMASQLGAVSNGSFNATSAATHCSQYMEVDVNGKKFVDWRLPTEPELNVIYEYQYKPAASDVITEVLGGAKYYNLHNGSTSNPNVSGTDVYVRCVRELSEDDLKYLRYLNGETVPGFNLTNYLNN